MKHWKMLYVSGKLTDAQGDHSLSNLFLRAIAAWIINTSGKVLNEADPLSDPHLLLLGQLGRQPGLAGSWVVNRHMDLLLKTYI